MSNAQARAPLASVLLPVHNGGRFVREALDSLIAQSARDLEIVVVNDGSTDATASILDDFARRDSRIRIVNQPQQGLVAALNRGLAECRGCYVARMDADDIAHPERIGRQLAYLLACPEVVAVGCQIAIIDSSGKILRKGHYPIGQASCRRHLLGRSSPLCHPAVLFRLQAVREVGGYRSAYADAEDYDLWLRLGQIGEIDNLPATLLQYRVHGGNVTILRGERQARHSALAFVAASVRAEDGRDLTPVEGWPSAQNEIESMLPDELRRAQFRHVYFRSLVLNGAISDAVVFRGVCDALPALVRDANRYPAAEWCDIAFTLTRAAMQLHRAGYSREACSVLKESFLHAPMTSLREALGILRRLLDQSLRTGS